MRRPTPRSSLRLADATKTRSFCILVFALLAYYAYYLFVNRHIFPAHLSPWYAGRIFDLTGSYEGFFSPCLVLTVLAAAGLFFLAPPRRTYPPEQPTRGLRCRVAPGEEIDGPPAFLRRSRSTGPRPEGVPTGAGHGQCFNMPKVRASWPSQQ